MGASDGAVVGLTRIVNAGPPAKRWNLVIVAEGYRKIELPKFAIDARSVADRLLDEPPFTRPEIRRAINIYRLDVRSKQSGADQPRCGDGGGTGAVAATFFDARFCFDGVNQRLLAGDSALAIKTVSKKLKQWHQIMVIVNEPSERGGAGGQVGWFSTGGADWRDVAIHEMGHSAFHLADEYDYGGPARWVGPEPAEPNVSLEADPSRVKWRDLVTAGPASPTRANPDCKKTDTGPGPAADVVGTFEGARYSHCGAYRPVWNCKMRTTSARFCPVCADVIVKTLAPFGRP